MFTIAHLSDIHFTQENNGLQSNLIAYLKKKKIKVDYLLITGDIADKGVYPDNLCSFLEELENSLSTNTKTTFICCGNHDIHRSELKNSLLDGLYDNKDEHTNHIKDEDIEVLFNNYQKKFLDNHTMLLKHEYGSKPHKLVETNDFNLFIYNTCIFSGRDGESKRKDILIGDSIISEIERNTRVESDKVNIAIGHHYFAEFNELCAIKFKNSLINTGVDLYLCGHAHGFVDSVTDNGKLITSCIGNTSNNTGAFPSFSVITIDDDKMNVSFDIHKYVTDESSWRLDKDFFLREFFRFNSTEGNKYKDKLEKSNYNKTFYEIVNSFDITNMETNNQSHYAFKNANRLVGRKKEIQSINSFKNQVNRFDVLVVTGIGGIGKSKLLYEYIKENQKQDWKMVFLNWNALLNKIPLEKHEEINWDYPKPLFIVIDYVLENANTIGKWIEIVRLQKYTTPGNKIRIVLIERNGHEQSILLHSLGIKTDYIQFMELDGLGSEDFVQIISDYVNENEKNVEQKNYIIKDLENNGIKLYEYVKAVIDKNTRPVFSIFIAIILISEKLNLKKIIRNKYTKSQLFDKVWKIQTKQKHILINKIIRNSAVHEAKENSLLLEDTFKCSDRILVFLTLAGLEVPLLESTAYFHDKVKFPLISKCYIPIDSISKLLQILFNMENDEGKKELLSMILYGFTEYNKSYEILAKKVEPDILGSHFVLKWINNSLLMGKEATKECIELIREAQKANYDNFLAFYIRSYSTFFDDELGKVFKKEYDAIFFDFDHSNIANDDFMKRDIIWIDLLTNSNEKNFNISLLQKRLDMTLNYFYKANEKIYNTEAIEHFKNLCYKISNHESYKRVLIDILSDYINRFNEKDFNDLRKILGEKNE